MGQIHPEVERRKPETGLFRHIAETLIGKQSRKVAFGVWGFIADNTFLATGKITEHTWWLVFLTCASLVGFGTLLDELLRTLGDKIVGVAARRLNAVIETKTETAVEKTSTVVTQ